MHDRYHNRLNNLRKSLKKAKVDAILVTNFTNVTYLTGFAGGDSYLLVTRDSEILLSDSRFTTELQEDCPGSALPSLQDTPPAD